MKKVKKRMDAPLAHLAKPVGPHRLQVKRQRDGERRAEALLVDGFPRFVVRTVER